MHKRTASLLTCALSTLGLFACFEREVARIDPRQSAEQVKAIDVVVNRDIDILFVVDNSGSMKEEQASLASNFDRFVNVLNAIEGGLPNVHIGVVSTDLGAGPYGIMGCQANGDNGVLQNAPTSAGCNAPADRWIENVALEDGTRQTNYSGTLAESFSCIAQLGVTGCGFEQPLESMRRALNGSNAQNNGFLRPDARLAVIIISDEDDCSVEDVRMLDSDPALDRIDSELGFLSSFRCFEFGVQCDPDTPRAAGPRENCTPRDDSDFMYGVAEYATFLRSLKDDPGDIFVAGIIGNPRDVAVVLDDGEPELAASCDSAAGIAVPGIRLSAFLNAFPNRTTTTTICNEDLSDAITQIALALGEAFGDPCLEGDLKLEDGEPNCTVTDILDRHKDTEVETLVPKCNAEMSNLPCFHYASNPSDCKIEDGFVTQLELLIERGGFEPPDGTEVVARCEVN